MKATKSFSFFNKPKAMKAMKAMKKTKKAGVTSWDDVSCYRCTSNKITAHYFISAYFAWVVNARWNVSIWFFWCSWCARLIIVMTEHCSQIYFSQSSLHDQTFCKWLSVSFAFNMHKAIKKRIGWVLSICLENIAALPLRALFRRININFDSNGLLGAPVVDLRLKRQSWGTARS